MANTLNSEQRKALDQIKGAIIINAGPGTGKTNTLVARIAHLIQNHSIQPEHILALTFTQKAAAEMRERLATQLQMKILPTISTFHAFAYGLLRQENKVISLISEAERNQIIKEIAATEENLTPKELALIISQYKSSLAVKKNDLVHAYNQAVSSRGLMDFDDMLLFLYELLDKDSVVRERVKTRYQYLHVDEFQDTNLIQYRILQQIAGIDGNLFVIGDPNQSIYSFRGADSRIFDRFKNESQEVLEVQLCENYRSGKNILAISAALFPKSAPLKASVAEQGTVQLIETLNEYTEADWIINQISSQMGGIDLNTAGENDTIRFSDFAIIYRTHSIARILEQKCADSAIPFQVIGGDSLYEQKEIKLMTALLFYLYTQDPSYLEDANNLATKPISTQMQNEIDQLKDLTVCAIVQKIESLFDFRKQLEEQSSKIRNLNQFYGNLLQFDSEPESLRKAVLYLAYLKEHEYYDPKGDKVTLMTIHASKGLEFNTVFICGLEQGKIPLIRQKEKPNLEEEKRLLYVAMTRAKQHLFLIKTKQRHGEKTEPSEFEKLFHSKMYTRVEDSAIEKIAKKIKKQKEKKSQMSLF